MRPYELTGVQLFHGAAAVDVTIDLDSVSAVSHVAPESGVFMYVVNVAAQQLIIGRDAEQAANESRGGLMAALVPGGVA